MPLARRTMPHYAMLVLGIATDIRETDEGGMYDRSVQTLEEWFEALFIGETVGLKDPCTPFAFGKGKYDSYLLRLTDEQKQYFIDLGERWVETHPDQWIKNDPDFI